MGFWKGIRQMTILFLAMTTLPTVITTINASQYSSAMAAYDEAPPCGSSADVNACRYQGSARVVGTMLYKYDQHWVEVAFDELNGQKASGDVGPSLIGAWEKWKPGDRVEAQMWQGKLTTINGLPMD